MHFQGIQDDLWQLLQQSEAFRLSNLTDHVKIIPSFLDRHRGVNGVIFKNKANIGDTRIVSPLNMIMAPASVTSDVVGGILLSDILEDIDRETKGDDGGTVDVFIKIDIQVFDPCCQLAVAKEPCWIARLLPVSGSQRILHNNICSPGSH